MPASREVHDYNCPVKKVTIWPSIYSNKVIQWFRQSINLERLNLVISQVKRKPPRITVTDYSRQVLLMVKDTLSPFLFGWMKDYGKALE